MKRRLFKFALFILLGAIVNLSVAWGCALSMKPGKLDTQERVGGSMKGPDHMLWMIVEYRGLGHVRIWSNWLDPGVGVANTPGWLDDPAEPLVPEWAPFLSPSYEPPVQAYHNYVTHACGWPYISMWGAVKVIKQPQLELGFKSTVSTVFAMELDPDMANDPNYCRDLRLLPLHPLWPGFAINTFSYAAILWLLILGPFTARRKIRRKRGMCIKCGYDLRGTDHNKCPECGLGG